MRNSALLCLLVSLLLATSLNAEIQNLNLTKIQKAVNEVYVVDSQTLVETPAQAGTLLESPDMIKTGKRSRVELVAEDGTVTRVGANTIFSFKQNSRDMSLQQGNVLFHSPPGRGGGTIASGAASASVLGTTIAVSATPNGGFKLLCLEGVAQINFPNGQTQILNAGQLTFVLPPDLGGLQSTPAQPNEQGQDTPPAGEPGPVLDFDLEAQTQGSSLVVDFDNPLPSIGKINDAVQQQKGQIQEGRLGQTGLAILDATDKDKILIIDSDLFDKTVENSKTNTTRLTALQRAIISSVILPGTIQADNLILKRTDLSSNSDVLKQISGQTKLGDTYAKIFAASYAKDFTGFLSGNLALSGRVSLEAFNNSKYAPTFVNILTLGSMGFKSNVSVTGLNSKQTLYLTAINYVFGGGSSTRDMQTISLRPDNKGTSISINSLETLSVSKYVHIDAGSNNLFATSLAGNIEVIDSNISGSNLVLNTNRDMGLSNARLTSSGSQSLSATGKTVIKGSRLTAKGALSISSTKGSTTLSSTTLSADSAIAIKGNSGVTINNSSLTAGKASIITAGKGQTVKIDSSKLGMQILNVGQFASKTVPGTTNALNQANLSNLSASQLSSLSTLSIAARTVNLQNVHFPSGSTVRLFSENGLANFGSSKELYVNFISNVTHDGNSVTQFDINPVEYDVNTGGVFVQRLSDGVIVQQGPPQAQ